jgi:cystathionine beta-synthase
MREHGFLGDDRTTGSVADLLAHRGQAELYTATPSDSVRTVISRFKQEGFSQVPVLDGNDVVGIVNERDLLDFLVGGGDPNATIEGCVETKFAIVEPVNQVAMLGQFFTQDLTILVRDQGRLIGLITKIDYIDFVSRALR